jgi:regulator of PEP synthase PpsR (kinase-PPPase family)
VLHYINGGDTLEDLKVFIISDSLGETGAIVAKAAISQFKDQQFQIKRYPYINEIDKLKEILNEVSSAENPVIIYTLVDKILIQYIRDYVRHKKILAIDIMSPILGGLSEMLGKEPSYEAGVIRKLDEAYFSRVAAIEFAVKYDDGKDPRGLSKADLVLVGISRTSKTPLSMYLANMNIKVANIPLVIESEPPKEIFEIPAKKIIGLTNSPEKLNEIREERLKHLGLPSGSNYASLGRILDELDHSEKIMKKIGCPVINVANKAIEETSGIILSLLKKNGVNLDR